MSGSKGGDAQRGGACAAQQAARAARRRETAVRAAPVAPPSPLLRLHMGAPSARRAAPARGARQPSGKATRSAGALARQHGARGVRQLETALGRIAPHTCHTAGAASPLAPSVGATESLSMLAPLERLAAAAGISPFGKHAQPFGHCFFLPFSKFFTTSSLAVTSFRPKTFARIDAAVPIATM